MCVDTCLNSQEISTATHATSTHTCGEHTGHISMHVAGPNLCGEVGCCGAQGGKGKAAGVGNTITSSLHNGMANVQLTNAVGDIARHTCLVLKAMPGTPYNHLMSFYSAVMPIPF